ncbi:UNVERIFIED_CONTAM: hypothetical protein Slati_2712900 [Sesamum latifolium]|uniref:Reverse transcriptase domain-containing protein n=1 Tax=Sesamum latifolium TaxID=2727402 RepID=A0AAW2VZD0_9LAMI
MRLSTGENADAGSAAKLETVAETGVEQRVRKVGGQGVFSGGNTRSWKERGKGILEEGEEHVHTITDDVEIFSDVGLKLPAKLMEQPTGLPSIQKPDPQWIQTIIHPTSKGPNQIYQPDHISKSPSQTLDSAHGNTTSIQAATHHSKHTNEPGSSNPAQVRLRILWLWFQMLMLLKRRRLWGSSAEGYDYPKLELSRTRDFLDSSKLGETLREYCPAVVFLCETKCGHRRIELIKQKFGLFGLCVPTEGKSGGLALFWQQEHEKIGIPRPTWQISNFRNTLNFCNLSDLGYSGPKFTWCNRRQYLETVTARLDRAIANPAWIDRFFRYSVSHNEVCQSDHKMMLVDMKPQETRQRGRRDTQFRFDADGYSLMRYRIRLLRWKRLEFDRVNQEIHRLEERYNRLDRGRLTTAVYQEMRDIQAKLTDHETREMLRWQQRSKEHWLANGDGNTNIDEVVSAIPRRVTPEMNDHLRQPFTSTEVKQALFSMFPYKSPGPDGFSMGILYKMNHTHVVLIPKCDNPETASHLRPISLCNVVLKIASKCLANQLKSLMNSVVSQSQSAFIPNRLITDNVLLAFELNHFLKVSSHSKKCFAALKIDMTKAYDRVEWTFLRRVLLRLGFESEFVELVMLLVTTVSYSLTLNGVPFGYFRPQRGIRQGVPLSPYLFIFCAEALSCLIQQAKMQGELQGIKINQEAPSISHLLFPDDTLLFCEATATQIGAIRNILDRYAKASG